MKIQWIPYTYRQTDAEAAADQQHHHGRLHGLFHHKVLSGDQPNDDQGCHIVFVLCCIKSSQHEPTLQCRFAFLQNKSPAVVEASSAAVQKGPGTNVATHNDPTANAASQRSATSDQAGSSVPGRTPSISPVRLTQ